LATVNGSPVERAHLDKALEEEWATTLLRSIIADRLIRQEARRLGIKATADEVADRFSLERGKFDSETAFQRHVRKQGLTSEGYLNHLTRELLLEKLLAQLTAVSEDEALAFYTSQKSEYAIPEKVHLHLIMTNTIEDAYLAGEKLAANEPFADVARELSVHPSAEKGGDMGLVTDEALPAAIAETIFALETGVTSKPLRALDKYYLAQISAREPGKLVSFEQARPQIMEQLATRKGLAQEDYINLLARRAEILVNWDPARHLTAEYGRLKQIQVIVDGEPLDLDEPLVRLPNGNIIAPAKPLLQAVGARVHWQGSEQSMTATAGARRVRVTVGSSKAVVGFDGKQPLDMNFAPEMRSGTLFIAPRPVLTALGATVNWDAVRNALVIDLPPSGSGLAPPPPPPPAAGTGAPALPAGPADMPRPTIAPATRSD
jgi:parvulin-like peptidyl-prolyl isomerase